MTPLRPALWRDSRDTVRRGQPRPAVADEYDLTGRVVTESRLTRVEGDWQSTPPHKDPLSDNLYPLFSPSLACWHAPRAQCGPSNKPSAPSCCFLVRWRSRFADLQGSLQTGGTTSQAGRGFRDPPGHGSRLGVVQLLRRRCRCRGCGAGPVAPEVAATRQPGRPEVTAARQPGRRCAAGSGAGGLAPSRVAAKSTPCLTKSAFCA